MPRSRSKDKLPEHVVTVSDFSWNQTDEIMIRMGETRRVVLALAVDRLWHSSDVPVADLVGLYMVSLWSDIISVFPPLHLEGIDHVASSHEYASQIKAAVQDAAHCPMTVTIHVTTQEEPIKLGTWAVLRNVTGTFRDVKAELAPLECRDRVVAALGEIQRVTLGGEWLRVKPKPPVDTE